MESVKTILFGKSVFLLTGVKTANGAKKRDRAFEVEHPDKLLEAARRNPDAVAFGYVSGSWVAAA
ncbi:MAG: hypothetical protein CTY31_10185 [Hyphomicrobium sp.]|nr:MAG: hypothetical protein CTY39_07845 [Hyphomicrobium sp.]PPC99327.1 MAG: hypothetical protein CTY31_10185 [Hyphomicrobium sp.]